jgi:hypothetical protein
MEKIFVINLDTATDRWSHYKDDKRYTRWSATCIDDLNVNDPIWDKMISYYNISPHEHSAKCCAYLSHTRLWKYIVTNKLNNVLILEDDAFLVNEIPDPKDLPKDGFSYLGGFTSHLRMTDGHKKVEFKEGINQIDHKEYRMLMCLAIFIPTWEVAYQMIKSSTRNGRCRAIDTMIRDTFRNQYVYYPACFVERPIQSQIRDNKKKFSNSQYEWVNAKKVMEEINLFKINKS